MEEDKILFVCVKEHRFGLEIALDQVSRDVNDWSGVVLVSEVNVSFDEIR